MASLLKKHGKMYLMEAAGLAGFVIGAALLTILLEHPDMPVMHSWLKDYPFLRRVPLGIVMGAYVAGVTLLFGKKSGAQINPAVTWGYYKLGKINFWDAFLYTIAQFMGAIGAALLLKHFAGHFFSHPIIDYGVTKPKPPYGSITAFVAEFIISFVMMLLVLCASNSVRFEKYVALISGMLLGFYLMVEIPFSGMSLNPARSFAGALAADEWKHIWIYFVAPILAILLATQIFIVWEKKRITNKSKDYKALLIYPVEVEK